MLIKLLSYLQDLIQKVKDILMARPRRLEIGTGEVLLKNFSKEEADRLVSLLTQKPVSPAEANALMEISKTIFLDKNGQVESVALTKLDMITPYAEMNHEAVGLHKDSAGCYHLVSLKYNDTQAMVVDTKNVGSYKNEATNDLKVLIAKKFL